MSIKPHFYAEKHIFVWHMCEKGTTFAASSNKETPGEGRE
jgi:hypothetical protein